ncbi:unnamed protein product [Effrenium voratum]|nr:unnamed protein product [Effrenium voratum]
MTGGYADRPRSSSTPKPKVSSRKERPDTKPMKFEKDGGRCGNPAEDGWRPGKRMNITAQDTGRIQNKTIVSVESPDWMKSFFENNRGYFEKQGIAQKLKKADKAEGASAAGVGSAGRAQGKKTGANMTCDETGMPLCQNVPSASSPDWMHSARKKTDQDYFTPRRVGERAGKERHTAEASPLKSPSQVQHLVVSDHVPDWMRSTAAFQALEKGSRPRSADDLGRAAGVDSHRVWDESARNKAGNLVHPTTGRVTYKSQQSPDFPLDSGLEHRANFEDTMRKRPHSARGHVGRYAGDRSKDRSAKKAPVLDQDTGKVANNSIVSPESPQWFKEPFENNRNFFESKGVAQKLKTMTNEEHKDKEKFVAGRKIPQRQRQNFKQIKNEEGKIQNLSIVSVGAPQWMKSPFESNRPYFESHGIAQARKAATEESTMRRSNSAPPKSRGSREETEKKEAKGVPSHAAERSARRKSSGTSSSISGTSRRTSSTGGYSRCHRELPRQTSLTSMTDQHC